MSKLQRLGYVCLLTGAFAAPPPATAQTPPNGGWVVIPVNEYSTLRARAFPAAASPTAPPVDATLTRVDYDLQIRDDLATGRANLTVDVVKDGWVRVPIPANLLVSDARLEGRPLSLVGGNAMLSKRGRSVLALNIALPINRAGGAERLTLPSSSSGITRASVTLGRQDVDVTVTGGLLAEKSESPSETRWLAYARGNEELSLSWRRKTEDHHVTLPLRFRGALTQLYGLGEDSTTVYAEVNLDVTQGAAAKARLRINPAVTVNQVLGANVGDWDTKDGVLTVTFLDPAEHSAQFAIGGETRLPREGAVDVPLLDLLDAEHLTGAVGVDVIGAGELKEIKPIGLEAVDPSVDSAELGRLIASRQSPSLAAFRLAAAPPGGVRSLKVSVARYTQQAVLTANIEEARYNVLMSVDGKDLVQARYAVRNNQRTFIKIAVPADAALWSASVSGAAVQPGKAPDGALLLPLAKAPAGEDAPPFVVEIVYLTHSAVWTDRGRATLALPATDLPISHAGLALFYPQAFAIKPEPGKFRAQPFERPSSPALNGATPAPAARPQSYTAPDAFAQMNSNAAQSASQSLVDKFRAQTAARTGPTQPPGGPPFPLVGPSIFLVSELLGDNQSPSLALTYTKDHKGATR